MLFRGVQNQAAIYKSWQKLIEADADITDDTVKMSTAIVLENAQQLVDHEAKVRGGRGLIFEDVTPGVTDLGSMGPDAATSSYANTMGDARVPNIVIPMIRRIYPQLIAHKLVGVQPMQGPIGMAFAFRAKYGRFGRGPVDTMNTEIGYLANNPAFTGKAQFANKYNNFKELYNKAYPYIEDIDSLFAIHQRKDTLTHSIDIFQVASHIFLIRAYNSGHGKILFFLLHF